MFKCRLGEVGRPSACEAAPRWMVARGSLCAGSGEASGDGNLETVGSADFGAREVSRREEEIMMYLNRSANWIAGVSVMDTYSRRAPAACNPQRAVGRQGTQSCRSVS